MHGFRQALSTSVHGAALAAGIAWIYRFTCSTPLLLDDHDSIGNNPTLRTLRAALSPPPLAGVGGRPLLNLSFAVNYQWGGLHVGGYHAVNLLIHVLAAWTMYALARRALGRPGLAFFVAAAWAWHPVQTEAVTYLSQRAECLMAFFYLQTLYWFQRERRRWLAVVFCLCGMATKETMVTAPLAVLLYDRTFLSGSFLEAWRRNRRLYLGLAATWFPLGILAMGLGKRNIGFGHGISALGYFRREVVALVYYVRAIFWPAGLVFDYGQDFAAHPPWFAIAGGGAMLAAGLAGTIWLLRRHPRMGFAFAWFFLLLAPTSSLVPIAGQPVAESRLYLPLAGLVAATAVSLAAIAPKFAPAAGAAAACALALSAAARNRVYASELSVWSDTAARNPTSARAHNNLGYALVRSGRVAEAAPEYERALALHPDFPEARINLKAARHTLAAEHFNRANDLRRAGRRGPEVESEYSEALRLDAAWPEAHNNFGNFLLATGRPREAIRQYEAALALDPDYAAARHNLAVAMESAR